MPQGHFSLQKNMTWYPGSNILYPGYNIQNTTVDVNARVTAPE